MVSEKKKMCYRELGHNVLSTIVLAAKKKKAGFTAEKDTFLHVVNT